MAKCQRYPRKSEAAKKRESNKPLTLRQSRFAKAFTKSKSASHRPGKVDTRLALPRVYVLRELVDVRSAEFRAGLKSGEIRKMARTSSGNSLLSFLRGNLHDPLGQILHHGCRPGARYLRRHQPQSNDLNRQASYLAESFIAVWH
jgi:hypothetical protein